MTGSSTFSLVMTMLRGFDHPRRVTLSSTSVPSSPRMRCTIASTFWSYVDSPSTSRTTSSDRRPAR